MQRRFQSKCYDISVKIAPRVCSLVLFIIIVINFRLKCLCAVIPSVAFHMVIVDQFNKHDKFS